MDDKATSFAGGIAVGVIVAVATVAAAVATGWFSFASKDEELRVHLVEIAIGILRADPKEDVSPARSWAMDAIDKYSGLRPFTAEERAALLHKTNTCGLGLKSLGSEFLGAAVRSAAGGFIHQGAMNN